MEGYEPQDFSFFYRGGKISTTDLAAKERMLSSLKESKEIELLLGVMELVGTDYSVLVTNIK